MKSYISYILAHIFPPTQIEFERDEENLVPSLDIVKMLLEL